MKRLWITPFLFVFSACSAPQIKTGYDPAADFSGFRTYAWRLPKPTQQTLDDAIRSSTAGALSKKGFSEVEGPNPDLLLSYFAVSESGASYGESPGPWRWGEIEELYSVKEGSLTLEFTDARRRTTLWQGTATHVIQDPPNPKKIDEVIHTLIDRLPR